MSLSVQMQKLAARFSFVGALFLLAFPAHAQESPARKEPSSQTEPAAKQEPAAKSEPAAQSEQTAEPEQSATPEQTAKAETSVDVFIAKLESATRAIHEISRKDDAALVRQGCRDLLNEVLHLDTMAQAVNTEIWEKMTPSQRETFRAAFEHRMISNCVQQFGGYEGQSMQLAGVRTAHDGKLMATIRVGSQEDGKLVTWRLQRFGPDSLRAVDVITEGRSVIGDARSEFAAILQSANGDIEALIAFLQK